MAIDIEVQRASASDSVPDDLHFQKWADAVLQEYPATSVLIRIVDCAESRELNARFRGQDRPTNVLSFAAELPDVIGLRLLGDIVLCAPLVDSEAAEQGKRVESHWAHLTIHGILHLLGFDHQDGDKAAEMETLEIRLLRSLGISNPYTGSD